MLLVRPGHVLHEHWSREVRHGGGVEALHGGGVNWQRLGAFARRKGRRGQAAVGRR